MNPPAYSPEALLLGHPWEERDADGSGNAGLPDGIAACRRLLAELHPGDGLFLLLSDAISAGRAIRALTDCGEAAAAALFVRSLFETRLYIEFLVEDSPHRSYIYVVGWLLAFLSQQRRLRALLGPAHPATGAPHRGSVGELEKVEELLATPELRPLRREYEAALKRWPTLSWYRLVNPQLQSAADLAERLGARQRLELMGQWARALQMRSGQRRPIPGGAWRAGPSETAGFVRALAAAILGEIVEFASGAARCAGPQQFERGTGAAAPRDLYAVRPQSKNPIPQSQSYPRSVPVRCDPSAQPTTKEVSMPTLPNDPKGREALNKVHSHIERNVRDAEQRMKEHTRKAMLKLPKDLEPRARQAAVKALESMEVRVKKALQR